MQTYSVNRIEIKIFSNKHKSSKKQNGFRYSEVSLVGRVLKILKVLSYEKYFTVPSKEAMVRNVCNIYIGTVSWGFLDFIMSFINM
jgi:hypothetical protein